jgi:hypothetical protein
VILFQSVSKRFKLFQFFEALFERLRRQAIFRFYFRFSRSRTPFLSKIIAFRKSPLIWPSCKICIKKASSHRDLLAFRTLVPGTGLEPVWIIRPRDFKSPSPLFHIVSKCFVFGCFREKSANHVSKRFKAFQIPSTIFEKFSRNASRKAFSKK